MSLSVSQDKNPAARSLYNRLGYSAADAAPVRVAGLITIRGQPVEVDDTLIYMTKALDRDAHVVGFPRENGVSHGQSSGMTPEAGREWGSMLAFSGAAPALADASTRTSAQSACGRGR